MKLPYCCCGKHVCTWVVCAEPLISAWKVCNSIKTLLWIAFVKLTNAITHAIFLPFANAQRLEPTPNCYGSQYIIDLHTDTEMHVSRTVFTQEHKSAIWMIIRLPVFWTVCTQIYIAMHNLNCAIQFTVRCALLLWCENSLGDWQKRQTILHQRSSLGRFPCCHGAPLPASSCRPPSSGKWYLPSWSLAPWQSKENHQSWMMNEYWAKYIFFMVN